ncbi:MAG TPA: thrombospondin type 3 repeat-containing protein [Solirubrobacter sp.]|nr:thrombospondin type 3 repeat-containing protein [Solirubrobacter sp.]
MYLVVLLLALALFAAPAPAHEDATMCRGGGVNHGTQVPPPPDDLDCDFVKDSVDNCPPLGYDDLRTRNPNQEDSDGDGRGDWCEADDDEDGVNDWTDGRVEYESTRIQLDNCRTIPNPPPAPGEPQPDENNNGVGDACEFDTDGDGLFDSEDNCPRVRNADQADLDGDRIGDACDNDDDGDYARDNADNCPVYPNPDQLDADGDGVGAACDDDDTPPAPAPSPTAVPTPDASVSVLDRQAPRVTVSVRATQRVAEVGDGLIVRVRCSEACAAKAEARVSRSVSRKLKLRGTRVVGTGRATLEAAGTTYAFVRFRARVRARLFRQPRTRLTLRITATDPAGNIRRETVGVTLRTR